MAALDDKSKLIFTNDGKKLIVSQVGGVKFAIMGFILLEGLAEDGENQASPCGEDDLAFIERWQNIEKNAKELKLSTLDYLVQKENVTVLLNNVKYDYISDTFIKPSDQNEYIGALENYTQNLYKTFYVPTTELITDKDGNYYGTYSFTFDRTDLNCDIPTNKGYEVRHIALIGKQYAENTEAVFNIANRQDAGIVAVAEIRQQNDNGIQILSNQNDYVSFQTQLRFTITDSEFSDQSYVIADSDEYEPVDDIASKLALVNNGVKTLSGGLTIGQNKEILDELQLGPSGAICMTKTLTVADCVDASDAENQFNAAGLIHVINKYPEENAEYVPQILMTSVHATPELTEDISAYTVGMTVKAEGSSESYSIDGSTTSVDAATFKLGHIPENDTIAVDIFGSDNKQNGKSHDRMLFSDGNSATMPSTGKPNVLINSDYNTSLNGAASNNNSLYSSNENILTNNAENTTIINSNNNIIAGGKNNNISYSENNRFENANENILIASDNNDFSGNNITLIDSNTNKIGNCVSDFTLYSSKDNILSGTSYSNVLFKSENNIIDGTSTDCMFLGAKRTVSTNDTKAETIINAQGTTLDGAYEDTIINSRFNGLKKTYFNGFYDDVSCNAVSSEHNTVIRSRFFGVKGLPLGNINSDERPILADVQSNNNIVMGAKYFDIYACSNNIILDNYKLLGSDSQNNRGPVRVKGSTIINSDKSKLYNVRDIHLLNSECTRAIAVSNFSDNDLNLPGTSRNMASTNELDSIYYDEYNNGDYTFYGLKGASYKNGAVSLSDSCRPTDMMKLKMMFINSFGSELNLAEYNPGNKKNATQTYLPNETFNLQNRSLMHTTVNPNNSVILGGHHNKVIGGENTVILAGEYCKASTYGHQILMGKFNKDVPADIVFGCGHFAGSTYIQGNKEYKETELKDIETNSGTIDSVRNENTCFNAFEFYAHQGKIVLRNCDDGHDAGTNVLNQWFGNSVTISPAGINWFDNDGNKIGEIVPDSNKSTEIWTFFVDLDDENNYFVRDGIGVPTELLSLNRNTLAEYLFKYQDMTEFQGETGRVVIQENNIKTANNILFANKIPAELNIIILNRLPDKKPGTTKTKDYVYINKIMPWYTNEGTAPKYLANGTMKLNYYYAGPVDIAGNTSKFEIRLVNLLDSSYVCTTDKIMVSEWIHSAGKIFNLSSSRGALQFTEFNSNNVFTEWMPNFK